METLTSETGPTDPEASASSVTDQRDTSCELGEDLKFSFEMDGCFGQCLMLLFLSVKTEQMVRKEMNK